MLANSILIEGHQMRLTLITMLVATMLAACGSLNTTRATNSDGTAVQATSASQSDATESNTKKLKGGVIKRVLVVDNSKTEMANTKAILEKNGFLVSSAENYEQTMQFLNESAADALPDLILMEVVMPGHNGFRLTRDLTRDARYQHIPIIMVTSKNQETDIVWALRQGAKDYVVKPVDSSELMEKIRAVNP